MAPNLRPLVSQKFAHLTGNLVTKSAIIFSPGLPDRLPHHSNHLIEREVKFVTVEILVAPWNRLQAFSRFSGIAFRCPGTWVHEQATRRTITAGNYANRDSACFSSEIQPLNLNHAPDVLKGGCLTFGGFPKPNHRSHNKDYDQQPYQKKLIHRTALVRVQDWTIRLDRPAISYNRRLRRDASDDSDLCYGFINSARARRIPLWARGEIPVSALKRESEVERKRQLQTVLTRSG